MLSQEKVFTDIANTFFVYPLQHCLHIQLTIKDHDKTKIVVVFFMNN